MRENGENSTKLVENGRNLRDNGRNFIKVGRKWEKICKSARENKRKWEFL